MKNFAPELDKIRGAGHYRSLNLPDGIDFSSNDYLGLATHPALRQTAIDALQNGMEIGATGSRLLRGHRHAHAELETFAATYFNCPRTLFFANGFMANYALITTLINRHDVVIYDTLCHASMRDGLHAAQCATVKIPHNNLNAFEDALKKPRGADANLWIMVESVYSMDGDIAPIRDLLNLAKKHDAILVVDEAHGTGIRGASGRGETEGLPHERLITLHTCGKALGVAGALLCASKDIIDYMINAARPFIYSTAPMPLQALLVHRALQLVQEEPQRRAQLTNLQKVAVKIFPDIKIHSQIIPIIIGDDSEAVCIAQNLQSHGFDIRAIRPPTVPKNTARLRMTLHVGLTEQDIQNFATHLLPLLPKARAA